MKSGFAALLLAAVTVAAPLFAHHSISRQYFMDQSTRIEGNVIAFAFENPHSMVQIESTDPQTGQPTRWVIEWGSVRRLAQRGVTKDSIKPGDHVIIDAYPSRDAGDHRLFMRHITRPSDGWESGRGRR
jgi:hypothetical protein